MPNIVVMELGKPGRQVKFEGDVATLGRSPDCTVVLLDAAVSRLHATIRATGVRDHEIFSAGPNAVVMVNGREIEGPTLLREGSEIHIGPILLIFSKRQDALSFYQGKSVQKDKPKPLTPLAELQQAKSTGITEAATSFMDVNSLMAHHELLRAVQKAWVQNVTPNADGSIETIHLEEDSPCLIGKGRKVDFRIKGFSLGGKPTRIVWKGNAYFVEHTMWYPKLTLNGETTKEAKLADGDMIGIGGNFYRFRQG